MQKASYSNIGPINTLSSQNISQYICKALKKKKQKQNTHTQKTSLTNFIFQK